MSVLSRFLNWSSVEGRSFYTKNLGVYFMKDPDRLIVYLHPRLDQSSNDIHEQNNMWFHKLAYEWIDELPKYLVENLPRVKRILLAGFGTGGVVACYLALMAKKAHNKVEVETYGCPRIGCDRIVQIFNNGVIVLRRYVAKNDPYVSFPEGLKHPLGQIEVNYVGHDVQGYVDGIK